MKTELVCTQNMETGDKFCSSDSSHKKGNYKNYNEH